MPKLGVNVDHVATLRQARREFEPDPVYAAQICERAGADSIVAHLREDRRHINDADIKRLRRIVKTRFNLEMSINKEIVDIALAVKPDQATFVPERRQEITTEGGLDVIKYSSRIKSIIRRFEKKRIAVSLFVDPDKKQIAESKKVGARAIELHTGIYARATSKKSLERELKKLSDCARYAKSLGLIVNAGHGLNYKNTKAVARIPGIEELNIGHAIISHAVFVGLTAAVGQMNQLIKK